MEVINKWNVYEFKNVYKNLNISALRKDIYNLIFINQENKYKSIKFVKSE